jgi:hypothetical protein
MSDLESYALGDVLPNGDIVGISYGYGPGDDRTLPPPERRAVLSGEIWVTLEQAEKAFAWGWRRTYRESPKVVSITRGIPRG